MPPRLVAMLLGAIAVSRKLYFSGIQGKEKKHKLKYRKLHLNM